MSIQLKAMSAVSPSKRSRSPSPVSDTQDTQSKRKRVDEEIEEMLQVPEEGIAPTSQKRPQEAVRDETYYMQDGSCILQVENTLFNVRSYS